MFNSDDVEWIMRHGLTGTVLALCVFFMKGSTKRTTYLRSDVSLSLHRMPPSFLRNPFQKVSSSPQGTRLDTNLLATLLHVDLWLKSIITPLEMSAKSPFRIRTIDEGLHLPSSLFYRLFLEHGLELDQSLLPATHLWVESNPIKYNQTVNGDNVTYLLGSSEVQIRFRDLLR